MKPQSSSVAIATGCRFDNELNEWINYICGYRYIKVVFLDYKLSKVGIWLLELTLGYAIAELNLFVQCQFASDNMLQIETWQWKIALRISHAAADNKCAATINGFKLSYYTSD